MRVVANLIQKAEKVEPIKWDLRGCVLEMKEWVSNGP